MTNNYCIIYNPLSGNKNGTSSAEKLKERINVTDFIDITTIDNYEKFFTEHKGESIIICGGDGTLNRFLNDISDIEIDCSIHFYPAGSGNDFFRDLGADTSDFICIDKYIKSLPVCTVNGKKFKFINGVGYGIDGYCCEVGDKLRAESDNGKKIDYTGIAIKGLLFHYKPTDAIITVDGVKHEFHKVWIAPTMIGRFYGGGMMPTPDQDRLNPDGELSVMIFHDTNAIQTLMIFPKIFKGEHVKKDKKVTVLTGKEITVEFSAPRPLQIDGETIPNVTSYTAESAD